MIVLTLLLLAALAILVIYLVAQVAWPLLLIIAVLITADVLFFKFLFHKKHEE